MPLHELPLQKCGTGHWLSDPCPKGVCDLLVFEKDRVVLKPVRPDVRPRLEAAKAAVEEAVQKSALSAAEKQKRYRERQKAKRGE